jgi:hypothetical protein
VAALPVAAHAADSVWWADFGNDRIWSADLVGPAGASLNTTGARSGFATGFALDLPGGRAYWVNGFGISWANLDGSGGGGPLSTAGATFVVPQGLAIDPVARRIYWANNQKAAGDNAFHISWASLDGSGGGDLVTGTAPVNEPTAVAIDPGDRTIYWTNGGENTIGFAALDGSGGSFLRTGPATVVSPQGIALDVAARRAYWASPSVAKVSFASLDNTGGPGDVGGDLDTTGTDPRTPRGIAVDPAAGRVYWGDEHKLAFARIAGGGGEIVASTTTRASSPQGLGLLLTPRMRTSPQLAGGSDAQAALTCSTGTWAPDLTASFLSQAPQSFAFQWSVNGADIPGATQSTLTATAGGDYRCSVSARNAAGATTVTTAPHPVAAPPPPPPGPAAFAASTRVSLRLVRSRIPARGPIAVRVGNGNAFAVAGTLAARTAKRVAAAPHRRVTVKLRGRKLTVAARGTRTVKLGLPKSLRRLLVRRHKLSLVLIATVKDPAGHRRTVRKTVTLKLAPAKRRR